MRLRQPAAWLGWISPPYQRSRWLGMSTSPCRSAQSTPEAVALSPSCWSYLKSPPRSVTTTVSCRRGGLRCFAVTSATAREMPGSPLMPKQVRTHAVNCTRRPGRPLTARVADRTSGRQGSRSHLAYLSATDTLAGQARSPKKGQGKFHFDVNRARRRQPSRGIKGPVPFPACRTLTGA